MSSHRPEKSMQSTGLLAEEVPGRVVSSRGLRDLTVTSGLDGVDQVGELDGILDEEGRHVDADDVCPCVLAGADAPPQEDGINIP